MRLVFRSMQGAAKQTAEGASIHSAWISCSCQYRDAYSTIKLLTQHSGVFELAARCNFTYVVAPITTTILPLGVATVSNLFIIINPLGCRVTRSGVSKLGVFLNVLPKSHPLLVRDNVCALKHRPPHTRISLAHSAFILDCKPRRHAFDPL